MTNSFDIGKWVMKLLETTGSYRDLVNFVNDKEAFLKHAHQKKIYCATEDDNNIEIVSIKDSEHKEDFIQVIQEGIEHSIDNYSNQMVVILATYIETIHSDFFRALFTNNPQLIYNHISQNNSHPGYVHLNLILESKSRDEIIDNLIIHAVKNISTGSLRKVNEKIYKITNYNIDKNLIKSMQVNILDKRNNIVHENKLSRITQENIEDYFELVHNYILSLAKACEKNNIPYIDQANWLK